MGNLFKRSVYLLTYDKVKLLDKNTVNFKTFDLSLNPLILFDSKICHNSDNFRSFLANLLRFFNFIRKFWLYSKSCICSLHCLIKYATFCPFLQLYSVFDPAFCSLLWRFNIKIITWQFLNLVKSFPYKIFVNIDPLLQS